jgi:hypothetical protein
LYFRTLLLQGGLPLNHISKNKSNYKNFLLAVLEEQPEKIEDFIFQTQITNLLPSSSRNDVIYENCFEIVQSILNDENYYEQLFSSNESIKEITDALKVKKKTLEKKVRFLKPQNYWLYYTKKNRISLRLGFADKYSIESLSQVLGFQVSEKTYQFYLNDELICEFRKMLNGGYKTDWHNQFKQDWTEETQHPSAYVIVDNKKFEVKDFIQITPSLEKPTLWSQFSEDIWRLIKGNGVPSEKALLMFPDNWRSENEITSLKLYDRTINFLNFEGVVQLFNEVNGEKRLYKTNVNSFDWTVISQTPDWVAKSNMPIVRSKPNILVYDEKNELIPANNFKIYAKNQFPFQEWQLLSEMNNFPIGCNDLKIEKDDVVAYDTCFNIGNLNIVFSNQTINYAILTVQNNHFTFNLEETPLLSIISQDNSYSINLNQKFFKIPNSLKASLKIGTQKSLIFELDSPFKGVELLDNEGKIICENKNITFKNLYGLRVLTPNNSNAMIRMQNELRNEVAILKESKINSQPLISFKDELLRLYYLVDAMDYRNRVKIVLSSGNQTKTYYVSGFTHTLDVTKQFERNVKLYESDDKLELFAVPLNCISGEINLIPLDYQDNEYIIPNCEFCNQFIIFSSKDSKTQLMPRFVNVDANYIGVEKNERIESYYQELEKSDFQSNIWKELLAYFNICVNHNLPFSTFDQIRAVSRNSKIAARAFFFLGINQFDIDEYIQKAIPEMEKDLGICFHWIGKDNWQESLNENCGFFGNENFTKIFEISTKYFQNNGLEKIPPYFGNNIINITPVLNPEIIEVRARLGAEVLNQIPRMIPNINSYYNIPIDGHQKVFLLINSPIAVAESILNISVDLPIWGGNDFREKIRRNIQYAQYIDSDFYNHIILYVLKTQN